MMTAVVSAPFQWRALSGPVVSSHLDSQLRHAGHSCKPSSLNSLHWGPAKKEFKKAVLQKFTAGLLQSWVTGLLKGKNCNFCHLESAQWQETPSVGAERKSGARILFEAQLAASIPPALENQLTCCQRIQARAPKLRKWVYQPAEDTAERKTQDSHLEGQSSIGRIFIKPTGCPRKNTLIKFLD